MQQRVLGAFRSIGKAAAGFTPAQKVIALVGVVAIAMGGFAFMTWASTPSYVPLFSNLAQADAGAIVEQLNADGVPYELGDGGNTVLVPQERVYDLRLALSQDGLPAGEATGYSLLDEAGVTSSDFQQKTNLRRAMEGELANTINAIDGVDAATVHLALPEKDVFLSETDAPTASVLIDTAPTTTLDAKQVQSVVHLVSSAVEGMAPENVTLVDADGQLLSTDGVANGGGRDEATTDYETRTQLKVQQALDRVLGNGATVATVTAELDLDRSQSTSETFASDPDTAPLSSSTNTETYTGGTGAATGVLGPDNIQVPGDAGGGNGDYVKEQVTNNNAVNKVTETREAAPGDVTRQSVAVVVDTGRAGAADLNALTEIVQTAAGVDPARGDVVTVQPMAFDNSAAEAATADIEAARAEAAADRNRSLIQTGALVGLVLLLILGAAIGARRRRKRAERALAWEQVDDPAALAALADSALPVLGPDDTQAIAPGSLLQLPADADAAARAEIEALVERQPDEVAELLRGWLADRRG